MEIQDIQCRPTPRTPDETMAASERKISESGVDYSQGLTQH